MGSFFLNSSNTSFAHVGLTLLDLFALGIAKGKSIFNKDLINLCLGNRTAIVLSSAEARVVS